MIMNFTEKAVHKAWYTISLDYKNTYEVFRIGFVKGHEHAQKKKSKG